MRVLLVYPNIDSPIGVNHGLSMISGVLREAGHETRLVHVNEKLFDVPTPEQLAALKCVKFAALPRRGRLSPAGYQTAWAAVSVTSSLLVDNPGISMR